MFSNRPSFCGLGRDRTGDLTIFSRSLVPTELPSQTRFQCHSSKKAKDTKTFATRTGLEPATSAVTGRRANQLRYRALKISSKPLLLVLRAPNGIRTRVTAVKGRCPRPLDDGDVSRLGNRTRQKACNQTALITP
jgi:integrase